MEKKIILLALALIAFSFYILSAECQDYALARTWPAYFVYASGIAISPLGDVYVSDAGNNCVQKFTLDGTFLAEWGNEATGEGQFKGPWGIAVDTLGNVYVADSGNHRIQKFTSNGTFLIMWGSEGSGNGQFIYPYGVAVDAQGNVYVSDCGNHRIQKFTSNGAFLTEWENEISSDWEFNPMGIAVDAFGNVYVADSGSGYIQKFTSEGVFLAQWMLSTSGTGGAVAEFQVAVDTLGNVYAAGACCIEKTAPDGMFLARWCIDYVIQGLSIDSSGSVYVAETDYGNNSRIKVYIPYESPNQLSANITSYTPNAPINVEVGSSVQISVTFTNTGNIARQFIAGASVWDSNGNLVGNYEETLSAPLEPGQQYTASWNHTVNQAGDYWLQFGVWKAKPFIAENLLDNKPSPSERLIIGTPLVVNQPPNQPINISPPNNTSGISLDYYLISTPFFDPDVGDTIAATQWQITTASGGYEPPTYDSGEIPPNIDSISFSLIQANLSYDNKYYWRVRYKDNHDSWSQWSVETSFETAINVPLTCAIELRKQGTKSVVIAVDIMEQYDIYVGNSIGDIEEVRFSWDNSQDGIANGTWTNWYDWENSSGNWNAVTKTNILWAFVESGNNEVWAEIKDSTGSTSKSYADIFVNHDSRKRVIISKMKEFFNKFDGRTFNKWISLGNLNFIVDRFQDPSLEISINPEILAENNDLARYIHPSWLWEPFYSYAGDIILADEPSNILKDVNIDVKNFIDVYHEIIHALQFDSDRPGNPFNTDEDREIEGYANYVDAMIEYKLPKQLCEFEDLLEVEPHDCQKLLSKWDTFIQSVAIARSTKPPPFSDVEIEKFDSFIGFHVNVNILEENYKAIGHKGVKFDCKIALKIVSHSPIDLIVTDPNGITLTKSLGEVPDMYYMEYDIDRDGEINDVINIIKREIGNYSITIVPEPNALPTDTYSLEVMADNITIVLANKVQISDIPSQSYIIKSTETKTTANPVANAGQNQKVIVGETVQFDCNKSYDPDGTIVSYQWDFGDGATGSGMTVKHIYTGAGTYTVTLEVKDDYEATGIDTAIVVVLTPAEAINDLVNIVQSMNLQKGINNSLDAKLQAAKDSLLAANAGNRNDAVNKLQAFINAVEAQKEKELTDEQANELVSYSTRIIALLSASASPPEIPREFKMAQNYPNPFNPDTWIPYQLPEDMNVIIRIYNASGNIVKALDLGHQPAGFYITKDKAAYWNGKNEAGEPVSNGVYFYTIHAGDFATIRKMLLLR